MTKFGGLGIRWRVVGRVGLSAFGGALLTVLAFLLFYRLGGLGAVAPPVLLAGAELQLLAGQGEPTPAGLDIQKPGPRGQVTALGNVEQLVRAQLYRRVSWQVQGLEPGRELRLIWVTLDEPRVMQQRTLPATTDGLVELGTAPGWQGRIAAIGLTLGAPLSQPLVIKGLELHPGSLTALELLRLAADEWGYFEDWSQRSINYTSGAPLDALFPPVLVVAIWVGFSAALHALLTPPRRGARGWLPYAALFLLGWLVLDLRWQLDLTSRLEQTIERFAGKDETGRRLADPDGDLYRFLFQVRQRLPAKPARLFIISADPADETAYYAGRARYHLLPHNGYAGLSRPPGPKLADPGDYVLILSPLTGVNYNRHEGVLEWENNRRLPAELLYAGRPGALYRVLSGT